MPLIHGSSPEIISHNIKEMISSGHPQNQAVAAALHVANHHARHLAAGGSPVNASALPTYTPQTGTISGTGMGQINSSGFVNTPQAGNYNLDPTTGALSGSTINALNTYAMRGLTPSSSGTTSSAGTTASASNPLGLPSATTSIADVGGGLGGMARGGFIHRAPGGPVNLGALPTYAPQTASIAGTGMGQINPNGFVNTPQAGSYNLDPSTGALSASTINALNAYAMRGLTPSSSSTTTAAPNNPATAAGTPDAASGGAGNGGGGGGALGGGMPSPGQSNVNNTSAINAAVQAAIGQPLSQAAITNVNNVANPSLGVANVSPGITTANVNTPVGANLQQATSNLDPAVVNAINAAALGGNGTTSNVGNSASQQAIDAALAMGTGNISALGTGPGGTSAAVGPGNASINGSLDPNNPDVVNAAAAQSNPASGGINLSNIDTSSTAGKIGGIVGGVAAGPIGGAIGWGIGTLGNALFGSSSTPSTPTAANPVSSNDPTQTQAALDEAAAQQAAIDQAVQAGQAAEQSGGGAEIQSNGGTQAGGAEFGMKKGGQVNKRALGGIESATQMGDMAGRTRMMASGIDRIHPAGLVMSPIGGRSDHIPMGLGSNSYVIPADVVSGIGQGNTLAGGHAFDAMLHGGPYGMKLPIPKISGTLPKPNAMPRVVAPHHFTRGGRTNGSVPTIVAGGERIVSPEEVARLSGGDYKKGHEMLDRWVVEARKHIIDRTKKLPGPVGAKK